MSVKSQSINNDIYLLESELVSVASLRDNQSQPYRFISIMNTLLIAFAIGIVSQMIFTYMS